MMQFISARNRFEHFTDGLFNIWSVTKLGARTNSYIDGLTHRRSIHWLSCCKFIECVKQSNTQFYFISVIFNSGDDKWHISFSHGFKCFAEILFWKRNADAIPPLPLNTLAIKIIQLFFFLFPYFLFLRLMSPGTFGWREDEEIFSFSNIIEFAPGLTPMLTSSGNDYKSDESVLSLSYSLATVAGIVCPLRTIKSMLILICHERSWRMINSISQDRVLLKRWYAYFHVVDLFAASVLRTLLLNVRPLSRASCFLACVISRCIIVLVHMKCYSDNAR